MKSQLTDLDNFFVEFPKKSTYQDRCLLIATAIMMDFAFFEENPAKKSD